jgi:cytochrome c551/c552
MHLVAAVLGLLVALPSAASGRDAKLVERGAYLANSIVACGNCHAQREMSRPRWLCVTQMFNHQTHHRGQVTTLLKQAGIDPGVTDMPWAPLTRDAQGRVILGEQFAL